MLQPETFLVPNFHYQTGLLFPIRVVNLPLKSKHNSIGSAIREWILFTLAVVSHQTCICQVVCLRCWSSDRGGDPGGGTPAHLPLLSLLLPPPPRLVLRPAVPPSLLQSRVLSGSVSTRVNSLVLLRRGGLACVRRAPVCVRINPVCLCSLCYVLV